MLFDLRGKRRRVVQVVYALLAAIFLIGFVCFGIGSGNAPGGIFDAIGLGGNGSSGSLTSQFDAQIDNANQQLAKDPKDTDALAEAVLERVLEGQGGGDPGPDHRPDRASATTPTRTLGESADAWAKYLKVNKGKPDAGVAAQVVKAYIFLNDASGAAKTQQIVAADQPSQNSYGNLAIYRYSAGDIAAGDAAAKKAVSLAPKSQRKQVKQQLDQIRQAGREGEEAAGEGAEERAAAHSPGAEPAPEPARRRRLGDRSRRRRAVATIPTPGPLAQLVEQETLNLKVEGSSPSRPMAWASGKRGPGTSSPPNPSSARYRRPASSSRKVPASRRALSSSVASGPSSRTTKARAWSRSELASAVRATWDENEGPSVIGPTTQRIAGVPETSSPPLPAKEQ